MKPTDVIKARRSELAAMDDFAFNCAVAELAGWKFKLHSARNMPNYANDLQAAWELLPEDAYSKIYALGIDDLFVAEIQSNGNTHCEAKTPARALASAWMLEQQCKEIDAEADDA